jgi:uncharacterized peroxidase-related enzyme
MTPIAPIAEDAPATRATLEGVRRRLGLLPNLMRVLARSPAALNGYLGLAGALGGGVLSAGLRERIALAVAHHNGCEYCLAAHAAMGAGAGLTQPDIVSATQGRAPDPRDAAALAFARAVLTTRGEDGAALGRLRAAGWGDDAAIEIIAHVALNLLTNRVNTFAATPVDFPPFPRAA